ncbi:MAG: RNA 3'-terminal phosphate cyclase, partial [Candidatus Methanomethylicia archaeon]
MVVEIDGSMLEGGGQILRMSIALSAVLSIPVRVFNIRAKRSDPGLKAQHITAIRSVANLVNAEVEGLSLNSMEVYFKPKKIMGGNYRFDIGTAGSTTLVLQSLLPTAFFSPSKVNVEIIGGTDNPLAPPVDYISNILKPLLEKMNLKFDIQVLRRGFYPRGGGIIRTYIEPSTNIKPIKLENQGSIKTVKGIAYSSILPEHIIHRMTNTASKIIKEAGFNVDIEMEILQQNHPKCALSPGCGIVLWAETTTGCIMGANSLGEIGKPAERVGEEAAKQLINEIHGKGTVDMYAADQLIIYMILAEGESIIKVSQISMHVLTCIELGKRFLPNISFQI